MDIICQKEVCSCGCGEDFVRFYESTEKAMTSDRGMGSDRTVITINEVDYKNPSEIPSRLVINYRELPVLFSLGKIHVKRVVLGEYKEHNFFIGVKRAFK